jgi:4-hydroxybenzoate polyprenyltransferase
MLVKITKYLSLIRFFYPTGTFLLLYPLIISFAVVAINLAQYKILGLFMVGAFLMRSAGCVINDLCDYKYDSKVARTQNRPLANGDISKVEAIVILFILLTFALFILLQFNDKTIIFGSTLIIPIMIYPLTKRFFKYPQIFLGAVFNLGVFLLWFALEQEFNLTILMLYIAFLSWTIGYDTIYAYQDIEDDKILKLNSTAINWGSNARNIVIFCYILFVVLLLIVGLLKGAGLAFYLVLNCLILIIIAKLSYLDLNNYRDCRDFFQFNNLIGLLVCVVFLSFV